MVTGHVAVSVHGDGSRYGDQYMVMGHVAVSVHGDGSRYGDQYMVTGHVMGIRTE